MALRPPHFRLLNYHGKIMQPNESVNSGSFNMVEHSAPLEMSPEVSFKGFSTKPNDAETDTDKVEINKSETIPEPSLCNLEWLEGCCKYFKSKLIQIDIFSVDDIINDLFKVYGKCVCSKSLVFEFANENAVGDGVCRDVYSTFYREFYNQFCAGINANVPSLLTEETAGKLGNIISHYFIQHNIFPVHLAKATFEQLTMNKVRDKTLNESFLLFVGRFEREIIGKCLHQWDEQYKQAIWDVLMDCGVLAIPNTSNLHSLILKAAKYVFVQKTFFALQNTQTGLGLFWHSTTVEEIDCLYDSFKVNNQNILECFDFSANSPAEEKISAYFQRWLRNASNEVLSLLLEFCSGSSIVNRSQRIKIEYVNRDARLQNNVFAKAV